MRRRGMTLVELLVVIAIIGMLAAILTPALVAARAKARQTQCTHNQGEVGKALLNYEMFKKRFPGYANRTGGTTSAGNSLRDLNVFASWPVTILKQLDRTDLWDEWREGRTGVTEITVDLFVCPSDDAPEPGALSYVVNCGQRDYPKAAPPIPPDWPANGIFHNRVPGRGKGGMLTQFITVNVSMTDIKDGTSTTLLLSENVQARKWGDADETWAGMIWCPEDHHAHDSNHESEAINVNVDAGSFITGEERFHYARPSSFHAGGAVATFCDGSTRFLSERIEYLTYQLIMTPYGKNAKVAGDSSIPMDPKEPDKEAKWRRILLNEEDLDL
jgi:prepilin-type N-terminal cleavage/methylation domain-containing protein